LYFFILIIIFIIILIYFFKNFKNELIFIKEFKEDFYIIPKDRGGVKINNTDKKSLNLNFINNNNLFSDHFDLKFSIQFYSNSDSEIIVQYLNDLLNKKETIFFKNDFYILSLLTEISTEYFLLYKNFKTRQDALIYCTKYLVIIDNCLIVDVRKFNN